mgnify:CR=1 FL=1
MRIYTLPGCSYCRQVKEFLADNGISYEEIDLDSDMQGQAFMDSRGYTALPVTVIGSHEISGSVLINQGAAALNAEESSFRTVHLQ